MGQRQVENKSAERVRGVFDSIAYRYDLANHLLSFGMDFYWRRAAVRLAGAKQGAKVLDMCCGTGDFLFSFAASGVEFGKLAGCDFSSEMIEIARLKEKRKGVEGINWVVGDCCRTEFADGCFDIVSCSFGVRNMEDLPAGLREMYRVLGEGGRACILEFSLPKTWFSRLLYRIYLGKILPIVGGLVTGRFEAYRYLARTVVSWDEQIDMAGELKTAGFSEVAAKKLSFGIATVYIAYSG